MIIIFLVTMALLANATSGLVFGKMWRQTRVIGPDDEGFTRLMVGQLLAVAFLGFGLWMSWYAGQPAP